MAGKYRKKPLTQFEHGTRIYATSDSERTYRVVARDPSTGQRIFAKRATEDEARKRAREIEALVASAVPVGSHEERVRTVGALAERYSEEHLTALSLRYREKQEYLLQRWILPRLADLPIAQWTSADSIAPLTRWIASGAATPLVSRKPRPQMRRLDDGASDPGTCCARLRRWRWPARSSMRPSGGRSTACAR